MNVVSELVGAVRVLTLELDALDASTTGDFRREIQDHLKGGKVIIDLSKVEFVDSSGLGAILGCLRRTQMADGDLKLCNMRPEVRATFHLVRMDKLIEIHDTRDDAIEAFTDSPKAPKPEENLLGLDL